MAKWAALAKKFKDAGIDIHILKWIAATREELYDYTCNNVVKTFGAKAFCTEGAEDAAKEIRNYRSCSQTARYLS